MPDVVGTGCPAEADGGVAGAAVGSGNALLGGVAVSMSVPRAGVGAGTTACPDSVGDGTAAGGQVDAVGATTGAVVAGTGPVVAGTALGVAGPGPPVPASNPCGAATTPTDPTAAATVPVIAPTWNRRTRVLLRRA